MLKAHQACIDLEEDVLRIKGRTVKFLPEHELPDNARLDHSQDPTSPSTSTSQPEPPARFPGSGNTLGGNALQPGSSRETPSHPGLASAGRSIPSVPAPPFPEKDIQTIMGIGVTREEAIETLRAANGNVEVAASLLFN
jgi:DNA damage-inducible protein 1